MFVEHNLIKNIKIFTLAFTLTVVLIQLSRFISPLAIIHSSYIFLAWMPLCVMLSILFIFGWRGVVPILCGMFCTNLWNRRLTFLKTAVMIGSQAFYEYQAGHVAGLDLNAVASRAIDLG